MEKEEEKDPQPLTDEELADYQKKEERKVWFLGSIIDFIVSFFHNFFIFINISIVIYDI